MDPVNLAEYEALARERVDPGAWGYIAGGAGDEITLRENRTAFDRLRLLPRVLVDVSCVDASVELLGQRLAFPVLLAPTAFQTLAHAEGELASARAAARAGVITVLSTMSAFRLEEVAAAATGPKWFQLYCYRDRAVTRELIERAERAGFSAICLTVDLPRVGRRERDLLHGFRLPPDTRPRNFDDLIAPHVVADDQAFSEYIASLVDPSLTWEIVGWLRSVTSLPLVLKGILRADDAALAVEHGVDGIVVSNHGARQLDTVPATIDALPAIAEAVDGRTAILLDGGVRRGTDVIKAIALGAQAVLIGRPYVWGLAAAGDDGVAHVLKLLRDEVELAMALVGAPTAKDIHRDLVSGTR